MKIGIVADCHIANHKRFGGAMTAGINDRGRLCIEALTRASLAARETGCHVFIVLGDLFDHTKPTPQLVRATANALIAGRLHKCISVVGRDIAMRVIVLLGNHDKQTEQQHDHAAASLSLVDGIEVVDHACTLLVDADKAIHELVIVPYVAGIASEWFPAGIADAIKPSNGGQVPREAGRRVVFTHLGIWDHDTPKFMQQTKDSVGIGQVRWLSDTHKIDAVFAGNWHAYKHWGRDTNGSIVVIPGTLCPAGFQEPDQTKVGLMCIYNSDRNAHEPISIAGPRFETVAGDALADTIITKARDRLANTHTYYRVRADLNQLADTLQQVKDARVIDTDFIVEAVVPDTTAIKDAARAAVTSSTGDLDTSWADLFPIDSPGTKEGVLTRLDAYRKASMIGNT